MHAFRRSVVLPCSGMITLIRVAFSSPMMRDSTPCNRVHDARAISRAGGCEGEEMRESAFGRHSNLLSYFNGNQVEAAVHLRRAQHIHSLQRSILLL
jgi:hypothetical protein